MENRKTYDFHVSALLHKITKKSSDKFQGQQASAGMEQNLTGDTHVFPKPTQENRSVTELLGSN